MLSISITSWLTRSIRQPFYPGTSPLLTDWLLVVHSVASMSRKRHESAMDIVMDSVCEAKAEGSPFQVAAETRHEALYA